MMTTPHGPEVIQSRAAPGKRTLVGVLEAIGGLGLPVFVSGAMACAFIYSVFSDIGLYSDGSNYFIRILVGRSFFTAATARAAATYANQIPIVLAVWLGDRSIADLAKLQTAGLIALPMACFAASAWLTRTNMIAALSNVFVICCVYFTTAFLSIGEFHILYSFFWLSAVIIVMRAEVGRVGMAVLAFLGLVLLRSYEVALITGALLAALCFVRAARFRGDLPRSVWIGLGLLFLLASAWAVKDIILPRDSKNEADFAVALRQTLTNAPLIRLGELVLLAGIGGLFRSRLFGGLIAVITAYLAFRFAADALNQPLARGLLALGYQSPQRAQVFPYLMIGFALLLAARLPALQTIAGRTGRQGLLIVPLGLVWFLYLGEVSQWRGNLSAFCAVLARPDAHDGDQAFFAQDAPQRYAWDWAMQSLSVVLRDRDSHRLVTDTHYHGWTPFDPATRAPDLAAYKQAGGLCRKDGGSPFM